MRSIAASAMAIRRAYLKARSLGAHAYDDLCDDAERQFDTAGVIAGPFDGLVKLDLVPVDLDAVLRPDGVGDLGVGHRAEEFATLAGFGFDLYRPCPEPRRELAVFGQ